jgi:tripartite ATP-independent transporter DctP family solute receptor
MNLVVASVLAGVVGISTAAAESLKLAHHHAVGGQIDLTAKKFKELAEEKSNGSLEITIFPAAQLGQQNEAFEQMDLGVIDMTMSPLGLMDKKYPAVRVASLPFIWSNWEHFETESTGAFGDALIEGMMNASNTRILGIYGLGFRDMIFRGDPITDVAGMKGVKMRSPEAFLWIRMFELLEAKPTPVTWGEVYTAMQAGVASGLEAPALAALDMKFNEVTKSLVRTQHMFSILTISIHEGRFNELSPEHQEVVLAAGAEAIQWSNGYAKAEGAKAYDTLRAKGIEIVDPDNAADWAAAMTPLWDEVGAMHEDAPKLIGLATQME